MSHLISSISHTVSTVSRCFGVVCSLSVLTIVLSACQSTAINTTPFREIPKAQTDHVEMTESEIKDILANQVKHNTRLNRDVAFHCTGLYSCDIASIDKQPVISHRSNKPYRSAVRKKLLHIDKNDSGEISYVGLMSSGEHLVNIRFYPISEGAFENFAVQHRFLKDKVYRFHGYRKPSNATKDDVSLLALASPRPMCIVLYEGRQPIRQFCKEADIITGVGRFVEEPVNKPALSKPSFLDGFQDNFFSRFSNG